MLKRYVVCINGENNISVSKMTDDINKMLLEATLEEVKENFCPIKEHEIGRIVKRVFPTLRKSKISVKTMDGVTKRESVYQGIRVAELTPKLSWDDVKVYSPKSFLNTNQSKWIQSKASDECVEWINVSCEYSNGERLVRSLVVFSNLSYKFFIGPNEVKLEVGDSTIVPCNHYLDGLFTYLLNIPICYGFAVEVDKKTTDQSGNVVGVTNRWSNGEHTSLCHRAVNCAYILSVHEKMCPNCSAIKHNSYYKTLTLENPAIKEKTVAPQKRETYMSNEELQGKLKQEKRKRVNCERREQYKQDIIDNMYTFSEEDSNDFEKMFGCIEDKELNPDMKQFWEAQKKAIEMKDGRGNRWHPK
jgi:hypothetical protein